MLYAFQNPHVHAHILLPRAAQTVHGTGFDKMLYGTFIHFLVRQPGNKILQIGVRPPCLPLGHHNVDDRSSHALDGGQCITDLPVSGHRKARLALIDIRGQDLDAHASAGHNIFRHFVWIINHGCKQCRHKFHRIIVFQVSCLVRHHRIAGRM